MFSQNLTGTQKFDATVPDKGKDRLDRDVTLGDVTNETQSGSDLVDVQVNGTVVTFKALRNPVDGSVPEVASGVLHIDGDPSGDVFDIQEPWSVSVKSANAASVTVAVGDPSEQ